MKAVFSLLAVALPLAVSAGDATVYLIRHGEKPSDGGNGLTPAGQQRAQCLTSVFGPSSDYDIGYIMAETPSSDGSHQRPYDTVEPLASELGLTIDTSCSEDDNDCVADVVHNYDGPGNILICWEHKQLNNIVEALGDTGSVSQYPGNDYGIIWTDPSPYSGLTDISDENCPGLGQ